MEETAKINQGGLKGPRGGVKRLTEGFKNLKKKKKKQRAHSQVRERIGMGEDNFSFCWFGTLHITTSRWSQCIRSTIQPVSMMSA